MGYVLVATKVVAEHLARRVVVGEASGMRVAVRASVRAWGVGAEIAHRHRPFLKMSIMRIQYHINISAVLKSSR